MEHYEQRKSSAYIREQRIPRFCGRAGTGNRKICQTGHEKLWNAMLKKCGLYSVDNGELLTF